MTRIVIVPGTLALLPEYASTEDPIAEVRKAVREAVSWLVQDGPARVVGGTLAAERVGWHLLGDRQDPSSRQRTLVVANGSARRTEKAPGHFDERAAAFDAEIGTALATGDPSALGHLDVALAGELWAMPDAAVLGSLAERPLAVTDVQVDYDDAPYGVQYWVVRWQCAS